MLTRRTWLAGICGAAASQAMGGSPAGIKVVAHPSLKVSELSVQELRLIYLGSTTSVKKAGPVVPVLNRSEDSLNRFALQYLGKTRNALETYYRSLVFTGRWSMPPSLPTDAEVVEYVTRTPGAIGFVREESPSGSLLTIRISNGGQ